jgi:hypothetical protein
LSSRNPSLDDLDEILSQLRSVLREHIARIEDMIEERRRLAELEHDLGKNA